MTDVPARLIVAYSLIALIMLAGVAIAWWGIHHSRDRVQAREQARRLAARQPNDDC